MGVVGIGLSYAVPLHEEACRVWKCRVALTLNSLQRSWPIEGEISNRLGIGLEESSWTKNATAKEQLKPYDVCTAIHASNHRWTRR